MTKCLSCGGTYEPLLPDGYRYFHVCPPLSLPELAAAVAAGKVVLPVGETPDLAVSLRLYERLKKRDENVLPKTDPSAPSAIKAAGKGTTPVAAPPGPGPIVIVDV